jgi:hypothetical protein
MILSYPLPTKGTKTSGFGYRTHPVKGGKTHHNGIDIGVPDGTEVRSVADGEVVRSDMKDRKGYGNFIIIKHSEGGETFYSAYAHLTKRMVDVGDKVKKGEQIALSGGGQGLDGGGGLSTGPHLHFEIRKTKDGDWVNPEPYLNNGEIAKDTDMEVDVKKDGDLTKDLNLTNLSDEKIKELLASLMKIPELGAKIRKERGLDENDQLNEEIDKMKNLIKKIL